MEFLARAMAYGEKAYTNVSEYGDCITIAGLEEVHFLLKHVKAQCMIILHPWCLIVPVDLVRFEQAW